MVELQNSDLRSIQAEPPIARVHRVPNVAGLKLVALSAASSDPVPRHPMLRIPVPTPVVFGALLEETSPEALECSREHQAAGGGEERQRRITLLLRVRPGHDPVRASKGGRLNVGSATPYAVIAPGDVSVELADPVFSGRRMKNQGGAKRGDLSPDIMVVRQGQNHVGCLPSEVRLVIPKNIRRTFWEIRGQDPSLVHRLSSAPSRVGWHKEEASVGVVELHDIGQVLNPL
jgi:hypothetical protein